MSLRSIQEKIFSTRKQYTTGLETVRKILRSNSSRNVFAYIDSSARKTKVEWYNMVVVSRRTRHYYMMLFHTFGVLEKRQLCKICGQKLKVFHLRSSSRLSNPEFFIVYTFSPSKIIVRHIYIYCLSARELK